MRLLLLDLQDDSTAADSVAVCVAHQAGTHVLLLVTHHKKPGLSVLCVQGGGFSAYGTNLELRLCLLKKMRSFQSGGAIALAYSFATLTSCILSQNAAAGVRSDCAWARGLACT